MKSRPAAHRVAKLTGKARLLTLSHLDQRTLAARRMAEIIGAIEADLGGSDQLSESARQLITHAAVLGAYIESVGAQFIADGEVDVSSYTAAINTQRRLLATLGLERRPGYHTGSEYLAGKQRPGEGIDLDAAQRAYDDAFRAPARRRLAEDAAP
ncbi:hypothetical protein SAMN05444161_3556 [Rhizobiales bacterium GAS191]|nr:hypothetical protein SAMN05444161_3556 [Rhizobiales bacterium GAS191]